MENRNDVLLKIDFHFALFHFHFFHFPVVVGTKKRNVLLRKNVIFITIIYLLLLKKDTILKSLGTDFQLFASLKSNNHQDKNSWWKFCEL